MHFILLRLLLNTFIVVQLLNWTWPKQMYKKHMESYITALKQDVTLWERGMLHMLSAVVLSFDFLKSHQCFVMPGKIWTNHSCFLFLFFPTVKYMREATPYVKKGSPVAEIGWETPPPESPRLGSPHCVMPPSPPSLSLQGDCRYIPLKMCYVTRAMTTPDPENR